MSSRDHRSGNRRRSRSRSTSRERRGRHSPDGRRRHRSRSREHKRSERHNSPRRRSHRSVSRSRSRSPTVRRHESPRDGRRWVSPERRDRPSGRDQGHHDQDYNDRRQQQQAPQHPAPWPPLSDDPPAMHSIHKGKVHTIRPFGMFVAIAGYRKHVMVHHTQIHEDIRFAREDDDESRIKSMEFFFPKGQEVYVKIVEIMPDPNKANTLKVHGSMKAVDQETGSDLDPGNKMAAGGGGGGGKRGPLSDDPPEVGMVLKGTVKRIEPYGVFVALEGFRKYGLVHSSQVSNYLSFSREDTDDDKKAELAGVVSIGETVFVKVVEVSEDDGSGRGPKVQCSIKLVDQKTGEDLDPLGTRYQPRGQGEHGRGGAAAPVGADAGNIVGGKINWGHLAGDVKLHDDNKGYRLLEDAPGPRPVQQGPNNYELKPQGPPIVGEMLLPPPPPPPPPKTITSVEEALAILEQAAKSGKKNKKDKKSKKNKKEKKDKKKKEKKSKEKSKRKSKHDSSGSSSSSSGSDSDHH